MRYNHLILLAELPERNLYGQVRWLCLCDCGKFLIADRGNVTSGRTAACGCQRVARGKTKIATKHGHTWRGPKGRSPTYSTWEAMHRRCSDPNHESYPYYGGRGIKVCDEWRDFAVFLKDMGERPEGKTLDRLDNGGNYCKINCRWATPSQQNANKRKK